MVGLGVGVLAVAGWFLWESRSERRTMSNAHLERQVPRVGRVEDGFASSDVCRGCHPGQYASWHASYHRTMTQVVTPGAKILGDFNDVRLMLDGLVFHLRNDADELWVEVSSGVRKRVVMATGSHHYQAYWVSVDGGRLLEAFPFVFLIEERRWVPREDVFLRPPDAGRLLQHWNVNCIKCHSTYGQPRLDTQSGAVDTRVAEMGIACESCHGEARGHVERNRNPIRRYAYHLAERPDSSVVNPSRLTAKKSAQVCGQCHSLFSLHDPKKWRADGYSYRPGDDLEQTRTVVQFAGTPDDPWLAFFVRQHPDYMEKQFWPDGAVRVAGREYNGLIESPCYAGEAFTCLSCHSIHRSDPDDQLASGMDSDEACLQCHEKYRTDLESHTRHKPDSGGSRCYNCHMPHTTFGLLKAIRTHRVENPSVIRSKKTGQPNACNLCHLDKTLGWTQAYLQKWYGIPEVELDGDEKTVSASLLWLLRGDAAQRGLAAWSMGWPPALEASGSGWEAPFLAQLLCDPYAAVRFVAWRALRQAPEYADMGYDYLSPLDAQERARDRVLALWEELGAGKAVEEGAPLLISTSGRLQRGRMESLLNERDDRPVELLE